MLDVNLADYQPLVFLIALIFTAGVAWALIRGAIGAVFSIAALAAFVYFGMWLWTGDQPIIPSAFADWLSRLPDLVLDWVEKLLALFR